LFSKDTRNLRQRMSGTSEEASQLLSEAFENPESTPVHLASSSRGPQVTSSIRGMEEQEDIIREAIGQLDSKDIAKTEKDRRETRC